MRAGPYPHASQPPGAEPPAPPHAAPRRHLRPPWMLPWIFSRKGASAISWASTAPSSRVPHHRGRPHGARPLLPGLSPQVRRRFCCQGSRSTSSCMLCTAFDALSPPLRSSRT